MNNIKIFTLSTNNYKNFNETFLNSFNNLFLPESKKEFIIFTDETDNKIFNNFNVRPFHINHESWPMITLKRYDSISRILNLVGDEDLCLFADIDLEIVNTINYFPVKKYFGVHHPGNFLVNNLSSLEDNKNSTAFVDKNTLPKEYNYIQGCLWGGIGKNFINMVLNLKENTEKDFANNIVAKWHDESHLNRFCISNFKDFNIFSSSYAYPEKWDLQIEKIILHKDKNLKEYPRFQGK